jgi:hypothetical protein
VKLFTIVHIHRDCGLKGGIYHGSKEKSQKSTCEEKISREEKEALTR